MRHRNRRAGRLGGYCRTEALTATVGGPIRFASLMASAPAFCNASGNCGVGSKSIPDWLRARQGGGYRPAVDQAFELALVERLIGRLRGSTPGRQTQRCGRDGEESDLQLHPKPWPPEPHRSRPRTRLGPFPDQRAHPLYDALKTQSSRTHQATRRNDQHLPLTHRLGARKSRRT